jgi:hypothetical protein
MISPSPATGIPEPLRGSSSERSSYKQPETGASPMRSFEVQLTDRQIRMARSPWVFLLVGALGTLATTFAPIGIYMSGELGRPLSDPYLLVCVGAIYLSGWINSAFARPIFAAVMKAHRPQTQQSAFEEA